MTAYLHSSMDRFEDNYNGKVVDNSVIYIPVWIDLKYNLIAPVQRTVINLHSSMDRFEELYHLSSFLVC